AGAPEGLDPAAARRVRRRPGLGGHARQHRRRRPRRLARAVRRRLSEVRRHPLPLRQDRPMIEVEALGRAADERAAEIGRLRRLPDDLSEALVSTGLGRAWAPARYGGLELPVLDLLDALESLA